MQEKKERKLRKDASENKRIILQAARTLFKEKGIAGTSMHQIAKAAGVGQGTLYRRYAHKGELCLDLLLDQAEKNCKDIHSYLDAYSDAPIEKRVKHALAESIDFVEEQCELLHVINAPNCDDETNFIYHSPIYKSKHALFRRLLEEIKAPELDATYTADLIMAGLAPNLFQFLRNDRGYSKEEIRNNLYQSCFGPVIEQNRSSN